MPPAFLERQPTVHVMKTKHLFSMLCRWLNQRQSRRKAEQCSVGTYSMLRWSCSLFFLGSFFVGLSRVRCVEWKRIHRFHWHFIAISLFPHCVRRLGLALLLFLVRRKKARKIIWTSWEQRQSFIVEKFQLFGWWLEPAWWCIWGRTITKPDVDRAQSRYQAQNNAGRKKRENIARLAIPLSKSLELCCARTVISFLSVFSSQNKR